MYFPSDNIIIEGCVGGVLLFLVNRVWCGFFFLSQEVKQLKTNLFRVTSFDNRRFAKYQT